MDLMGDIWKKSALHRRERSEDRRHLGNGEKGKEVAENIEEKLAE